MYNLKDRKWCAICRFIFRHFAYHFTTVAWRST